MQPQNRATTDEKNCSRLQPFPAPCFALHTFRLLTLATAVSCLSVRVDAAVEFTSFAISVAPIDCRSLHWERNETTITVRKHSSFDNIIVLPLLAASSAGHVTPHVDVILVSGLDPGCPYNISVWKAGYQVCSIILYTVPNPPENISGSSISEGGLLLLWTAPDDINKDLYWYAVSWESQNYPQGNQTAFIQGTSLYLWSLNPGNLYLVTISSFLDDVGSAATPGYIQTLPQTPNSLTVDAVNSSSASVSWKLTLQNMSVVSGFQIRTYVENTTEEAEINIENPNTTRYIIEKLSPSTNYTFELRSFAINRLSLTAPGRRKQHGVREESMVLTYSESIFQPAETELGPARFSCYKPSGGYTLSVHIECPLKPFSGLWVLVDGNYTAYTQTCVEVLVNDLQPAHKYQISVELMLQNKTILSPSLTCETDTTGMLIAIVLGVLLPTVLIGWLVFHKHRKRRRTKARRPGPEPDLSLEMTNL
ncbi:hypothetical protein NDU88_009813 [Pleurodeles waltl]|uniref:Fibronectin type-III domain-containing protein n=1 Tax=Pleurodeles waltl TaxID=8319 RepID=A0AAV7PTH5_PLEWA|nr:hypothetical protein NDU88_009813 [Pleurodeles waltl]